LGKGRSYEKRDHFFRDYYRARLYRERLKKLEELGSVSGADQYPKGPRLKCILGTRGEHGLRIHIPKELLTSYLGNEPCWVKLVIKDKILYRKYNPKDGRYFNIPEEFGTVGKEVEVTIDRLSLVEFVRMAIGEGRSPFSIEIGQGGGYYSTIGNKRIPLSLLMDLHPEWGEHKGPAVIFTMEDYKGERHGIKIAHDGYSEPFIGIKARIKSAIESNDHSIMVGGYRPIVRMAYDDKTGALKVGYYHKGQTHAATIWLGRPEFEKLGVDVWFAEISEDRVEGIISEESYVGIDWNPKQETTQKGIFGTKIECTVLKKLSMEGVTYDESGTNYAKGSILNAFDVTYFDESG